MRLPPNAAAIMRARRAGLIPKRGIFGHVSILPDWNFETAGAFVNAPPSLDPAVLDFSFLAGLNCCVFFRDCDDVRMRPLLLSIMRGDPLSIVVVSIERAEDSLSDGVTAIFERRSDSE